MISISISRRWISRYPMQPDGISGFSLVNVNYSMILLVSTILCFYKWTALLGMVRFSLFIFSRGLVMSISISCRWISRYPMQPDWISRIFANKVSVLYSFCVLPNPIALYLG